jgi:predicted ABC-class ATPase
MKDKQEFFQLVSEIEGAEVNEFSRIIGDFDFSRFVLKISRVSSDPDPSGVLFMVRVPQQIAAFPAHLYNTPIRRTALEDLLTRKVAQAVDSFSRFDDEGVARRRLQIAAPGQKILPRSALIVSEEYVEARLYLRLPSRAGRILGEATKQIFFEDLPRLVSAALIYCNLDDAEVEEFVNLMEDADQVRQALPTRGLIGFVGEGAQLARAGSTDLPDPARRLSLAIDDKLRIEMTTPNAGAVKGIGISTGVTVILGDEYSGRVELMRALAAGIYNHIPGDGREWVITMPDAVYVAADRGRSVQRVDVSPFLQSANGRNARNFSSDYADACAAQVAATIEALEVGARALILDESDSSAAFLTSDARFSTGRGAGVIPLAARVRQLADELGISVVAGGSASVASLIPAADVVLRVADGRITDITQEAKSWNIPPVPAQGDVAEFTQLMEKTRWVMASSIDASAGRQDVVIHADSVDQLRFGRTTVDLRGVTQLADRFQTLTIGLILQYGRQRYMDEGRPIREILDLVDRDLSTEGLECISRDLRGDLVRPRRYEIAAALNRLRTLRVSQRAE